MGQGNGTHKTLLCELHSHTTWSDGELTLRELADLYGRAGFDVLCVTDHVLRSADPWRVPETCVHEANFHQYIAAVDVEAERARALYGMLVVPGLELTHNHREPDLSAHALALGLREFVTPDLGLVGALMAAREAGAALIAAHPHGPEGDPNPARTTRRFWREWDTLSPLLHRVELFNQADVYGWAATGELPAVAGGDVHRAEHLTSWKTLVPCEREERALVSYLRSGRATYLVPFRAAAVEASVAAA